MTMRSHRKLRSRVRLAVLVLLLTAGASACGSGGGGEPPVPSTPPIVGEEVLAKFVDAEKQHDAAGLTAALGAGADLGKAADGIRDRWDAGRKRTLSLLGRDGLVKGSASRFRLVSLHRADQTAGSRPGLADFDFVNMAWATWSLGLLYVGNESSGTARPTPETVSGVTTAVSTTVTAVRRGPLASVTLSTTRSLTSTAGWSVSQTASVKLELPLCPDRDGVIAFDLLLELETTGSSGTGGRSSVRDTLTGHTIATVDDDARLVNAVTTGGYDQNSTAQGPGLGVQAAQSAIHVSITGSGTTASSSGDATDAQVQQARTASAVLLAYAGRLAALRAGDFYQKGYCTEIVVSPDNKPTEVALNATQPFDVRVRHKWENTELTDRVTPRLEGQVSISPNARTATPVTINYVAPNEKNRKATIHLESRSRRGIALKDVAVRTPGGYAIHDIWTLRNGMEQKMDGVSCDSPYGPWHVVISGDLAAAGWSRFNAYYDIVADPNTGKGTVRGEEHSETTERHTYDGTSNGTAQITANGDGYLIKLEIDYDITWDTPEDTEDILGQDKITGHITRDLDIIPATDQECA
jgi:hypothetical protein